MDHWLEERSIGSNPFTICSCSVVAAAAVLQPGHARDVRQHPPQAAGDAGGGVDHGLGAAAGLAGEVECLWFL